MVARLTASSRGLSRDVDKSRDVGLEAGRGRPTVSVRDVDRRPGGL